MTDSASPADPGGADVPRPVAGLGPVRLIVSVLVLIAAAALGWWLLDDGTPPVSSAAESETPATAPAKGDGDIRAPTAAPVPVQTGLAHRGELIMRITATGHAEATRLLELEATAEGAVRQVLVGEGDAVAEDDLLVQIDDTELRLDLARQREALVRALAAFAEKQAFLEEDASAPAGGSLQELQEAWRGLLDGMATPKEFRETIDAPRFDALFATVSRDEVMAAQDRLFTSRADFQQAEMRLRRAAMRAPFDAQVAALEVVEGERVSDGQPLLTLVDADPIRVRVQVLESEAALVQRGRRAGVRFAAFPAETFQGRVETISPVVDPESKSLEVIVSLPNVDRRLKPGMFAQITLDAQIFEDRLLVPATAVLVRDDRPLVFVVEGERARWVYIETGQRNDDWVEVLDGVEAGDRVITDGHYTLAHDTVVRVVEDVPDEGGDVGR